jgi:nucleobase:cation symporter-1, NCS1 family
LVGTGGAHLGDGRRLVVEAVRNQHSVSDDSNRLLQEAQAGRLPVLPHERIYGSYGSLLWTTAVLSAASWAYLIGSAFPAFGNTWLSIIGYLAGLIIGEVIVVLAVGMPAYRYGLDAVDVSKAALGTRGSVLLLIAVLAASIGWAYVLVAMTARGVGHLAQVSLVPGAPVSEPTVDAVAIVLLVLVWYLARRGPAAMERLSRLCAPGQMVIALLVLILLLTAYGSSALAGHGAPANQAVTTDPLAQLAYAAEFGFDNALGVLPFLGGLTRLVRHKHHVVGPTVVGSGIVGAALVAAVAALAADVTGDQDPITWMIKLAGPVMGSLMVVFLLVANLGTLVVLVYVAGVAIQQIRLMAALRWQWVIALTLLPGVVVAFHTEWLLDHVMTWLAYNGVMFVGVAAVMFTDYYCLRGQRLSVPDLFAKPPQGAYWYRGGVNWVAIAVLGAAAALYLSLFDPVSLRIHWAFRYAGAGIPSVIAASIVYYAAMRLTGAHGGGSRALAKDAEALEVTL